MGRELKAASLASTSRGNSCFEGTQGLGSLEYLSFGDAGTDVEVVVLRGPPWELQGNAFLLAFPASCFPLP